MKRINKIKKIIAIGAILILIFSWNINFVLADWVSFDAVSYFNDILSDMGVDKAEMKYNVQTMNVSRQKKQPPLVSVSFSPSNPVSGDKVRAEATPSYFMNEKKDLYFTWFLKQKDCDKTSSPNSVQKEKCDFNNDGKINIEDYKIKATRIIVNADFEWEKNDYSNTSDSDGYSAIFGGNDQGGKNKHCFIHNVESGDEYEIECDGHLFAEADYQDFTSYSGEKINLHENSGDNSFGRNEEKFWHTDTNDNDTAKLGNVDEANVVGLGLDSFSWVYEEGDEVGVVVEGVSVEPTQEADASYRTMWAMPISMCEVTSDIEGYPKTKTETISVSSDTPEVGQTTTITKKTVESIDSVAGEVATIVSVVTTTTTVTDSVTGEIISENSVTDPIHYSTSNGWDSSSYSTGNVGENISTSIKKSTELNQCLYDNLISPVEISAEKERLEIQLSYSPQNPINSTSPDSTDGDMLVIHASVPNAKDENFLKYIWEVYGSDEPNPESWGNPISKDLLPESSNSSGIGLNIFEFRLNFTQKPIPKYLKIKATVSENVSGVSQREWHEFVVVPIYSTSDQISVFGTKISEEGDLLTINSDKDKEICKEGMEKALCPVFKNEIVALEVDDDNLKDFFWTIDGKGIVYPECFFEGCNESSQTNKAFFAVLKNEGGQYSIGFNATNQETGEKISLSKIFSVKEPTVKISSADETACAPKLKGYYVDLDGKKWEDYSEINFWALTDYPIKLTAKVNGRSISSYSHSWFYNDIPIGLNNAIEIGANMEVNEAGDEILILDEKTEEEKFSVSIGAVYVQDDLAKKALKKYWGIGYDKFYEKQIADSVNIDVVNSLLDVTKKENNKILANLSSALPQYSLFLLRIVLMIFVLLFVSNLIFSISSEKYNEK